MKAVLQVAPFRTHFDGPTGSTNRRIRWKGPGPPLFAPQPKRKHINDGPGFMCGETFRSEISLSDDIYRHPFFFLYIFLGEFLGNGAVNVWPPSDRMLDRHDSILETGLWEQGKKSRFSVPGAVKWVTDIIRPAIMTRGPRNQLRRTAYLDGLRGFAALLVYWQHHELWPRHKYFIQDGDYFFENGWGWCFQIFYVLMREISIRALFSILRAYEFSIAVLIFLK